LLRGKITLFIHARRVINAILRGGIAARAIPLRVLRPLQAVRFRAIIIRLYALVISC
jgi:hypothetical protein